MEHWKWTSEIDIFLHINIGDLSVHIIFIYAFLYTLPLLVSQSKNRKNSTTNDAAWKSKVETNTRTYFLQIVRKRVSQERIKWRKKISRSRWSIFFLLYKSTIMGVEYKSIHKYTKYIWVCCILGMLRWELNCWVYWIFLLNDSSFTTNENKCQIYR